MSAIEVSVEVNAGQQIELTEMPENVRHRDPLYLFLCHLEWQPEGTSVPIKSSWRHSMITTTAFAWLQKCCCIEAHHALSQPREGSKHGEGAAVPSRKMSGKLFAIFWTGAQWQHRR